MFYFTLSRDYHQHMCDDRNYFVWERFCIYKFLLVSRNILAEEVSQRTRCPIFKSLKTNVNKPEINLKKGEIIFLL